MCFLYSLHAIQRGILNENPFHIGWIHRLTRAFACYTGYIVGCVVRWLNFILLYMIVQAAGDETYAITLFWQLEKSGTRFYKDDLTDRHHTRTFLKMSLNKLQVS